MTTEKESKPTLATTEHSSGQLGNGIFQLLTSDFTFKKVFGMDNPGNFLLDFLNCALGAYVGTITEIQYLPTELMGIVPAQRGVVFDIYCRNQNDDRFLIEMQRAPQQDFVERTFLNMSRAISNASRKGSGHKIKAFYSLNILDFKLPAFNNDTKVFHACFVKNEDNEILSPKVAFFYINLCNFANWQPGLSERFRNWLFMFTNMHKLTEEDYKRQESYFKKLLDDCRINNLTEVEMREYEKSITESEAVKASLKYVEELAYQRGIAEGEAKGEANAKLAIASLLLAQGVSLEIITKTTGLTAKEIGIEE